VDCSGDVFDSIALCASGVDDNRILSVQKIFQFDSGDERVWIGFLTEIVVSKK